MTDEIIIVVEETTVVESNETGPKGATGQGSCTPNLVTEDVALEGDNEYSIQKDSGLCELILPELCAFGKVIEIDGHSEGGWKILQNEEQQIINSGVTTTAGIGHGFKSGFASDSIRLRCIIANTLFQVVSISGLAQAY